MKLEDVDLCDLDRFSRAEHHEMFTKLRAEDPVYWQEDDFGGYWNVTKHQDLIDVNRDTALFSSEIGGTMMMSGQYPIGEDPDMPFDTRGSLMLDMDPPKHTRYRLLVNKGFTPRVINTYEERIRALVAQCPGVASVCHFVYSSTAVHDLRGLGAERAGIAHFGLHADVDAILVRSATQVDAEAIAAAKSLKVIARAGVGLDNVDIKAATQAGVMVVNAPTSNIVSAAELAVALMLAAARHISPAHAALTRGEWKRSRYTGIELYEKTVGIVGLGRIGVLVAQRLAAFGMNVLAFDPYVSAERYRELGVDKAESSDDVYAEADFLTVHLPRTPETEAGDEPRASVASVLSSKFGSDGSGSDDGGGWDP